MADKDPKIAILQGQARIAELELAIDRLRDRKKKIEDYLAKLGATKQPAESDPTLKREVYSEAFEELWKAYLAGTQQHAEKKKAFQVFKKIPVNEYPLIRKALENYLLSDTVKRGFARHFFRFLKEDFWPGWINKKPTETEERTSKEIVKSIFKKGA